LPRPIADRRVPDQCELQEQKDAAGRDAAMHESRPDRAAEAEPREIHGEHRAERERRGFLHHAEQAEPRDLEAECDQARQRIDQDPA